jgi:DNA-binding NarL/FixJ family response regulator
MHSDIGLFQANSADEALAMASNNTLDLVIVDQDLGNMTGLEFISKLLSVNPMINSAVVSSLSSEEYHEASEGLGIMAQLPVDPGVKDTEELLIKLREIKGMLT